MTPLDLVPYALLGVAGSLHCAGMCGPLALSFALGRGRAGGLAIAGYVVGKAAMYAVLALVAARGVAELGARQPDWMEATRSAVAWIAGLVMLAVAFTSLGWVRMPRWRAFGGLERLLRSALRGAEELPAPARGVAFGAANGLLPCGLSWSAIALGAATDRPLVTVLGPFLFGLCTGPVLAGIALGARQIPLRWRARGQRVAALGLVAYGVWTLARGAAAFAPQTTAKVLPDCCAEHADSGALANGKGSDVKTDGPEER